MRPASRRCLDLVGKARTPRPILMRVSMTGWWKVAEWIRKPHFDSQTGKTEMLRNRGKRRTIPPRSLVHESVFKRDNGRYCERVPKDAIESRTEHAQDGR